MLYEFYKDLPDSMEQTQVLHYIDEVLAPVSLQSQDRVDTARALYELADRHWHTYEAMPSDYKARIEQWITKNWDDAALTKTYVETIASIVGCLGLINAFALLESALLRVDLRSDVRKALDDAIKELKPNVGDPYSGLRH